jgi:hypothetical protein
MLVVLRCSFGKGGRGHGKTLLDERKVFNYAYYSFYLRLDEKEE